MKRCPICDQKMDVWTAAHKNQPFVDNKMYPAICFTCYHVPKTKEQKYKKDGSVEEDVEIPYCYENLYSAKELYESGSADNIRQAKICLEAVQKLCSRIKSDKKPKIRPLASWNVV